MEVLYDGAEGRCVDGSTECSFDKSANADKASGSDSHCEAEQTWHGDMVYF
jgi:hypothetical protein